MAATQKCAFPYFIEQPLQHSALLQQIQNFRSHCCQIFQVLTHHSCSQVSALVKGQGMYQVQASLSHTCILFSYYLVPLLLPYLFKLISVQSLRSRPTRSPSVVTISRPHMSSSLKIRPYIPFFQHAAPDLWNKLPHSFREPHPHLGLSPSHHPTHVGSTLASLSFSP